MIDQTKLPVDLVFIECKNVPDVIDAIKSMKVRGAPVIGVSGAMGAVLSILKSKAKTKEDLLRDVEPDCLALKSARPTAINLSWGVDKVIKFIQSELPEELDRNLANEKAIAFVEKLADQDITTNKQLSELGSSLLRDGDTVLTHCN